LLQVLKTLQVHLGVLVAGLAERLRKIVNRVQILRVGSDSQLKMMNRFIGFT
jgi:hypothetical protein